jgi:CcmD family protein
MLNQVNPYLALAYSFLWLLFMIYAWSLSRRQAKLRKEIEELKAKVMSASKPSPDLTGSGAQGPSSQA